MEQKHTVFLILSACILLAIAVAGCTGSGGTTPSASGASSGTSSAAASSASELTTSPTDAVPSQNAVSVTVKEKDYLGTIPVVFDGGMGQIHVKKIDVTLYRSDGQVQTTTIGTNKGDSVDLAGTKQTDRVVVSISFDNGQTYKVTDVLSPYRTRG